MSSVRNEGSNSRPTPPPRSPPYPYYSLRKAVDFARRIHDKEHTNAATRATIAGHLNLHPKGSSGIRLFSSLTKFGLLEPGGGKKNTSKLEVSGLAVDIVAYPGGHPKRTHAIGQAAGRPDLYKKLNGEFPGGTASDDNMVGFLVGDLGFTRKAARIAIRAYRDTLKFLQEEGGSLEARAVTDSEQDSEDAAQGEAPDLAERRPSALSANQAALTESGAARPLRPGRKRVVFALDEGDVEMHFPENLSPESLKDLRDYLLIFCRKAERLEQSVKEGSKSADAEESTDSEAGDVDDDEEE